MARIAAIALFALALAACGRQEGYFADEAPAPAEAPMAAIAGVAAEQARGEAMADYASDAEASGPAAPRGGEAQASVSYLAYAYAIGIELPGARLIPVMEAHMAACRNAGPQLCQLTGSERSGDPEAYIFGSVSLRGEPAWLQRFMAGVAHDADEAGGRIKSQSTSTEDLTRAIIDTEATLRAKKALRDRLQRLLESRPGRLSDLLEVERELARVQSEIDSTESNLAAMRTRVSMSVLTLGYQSSPRSVASDTFEPLGQAFASFISYIVMGVATIVTLIAVVIPWALLGAVAVWGLLAVRKWRGGRLLPRRGGDKPPEHPPAANA